MLLIGTVGMRNIEHVSWLHAFYFISMIATAQGPPEMPATGAGQIFASLMAFISVGTVFASLGFLFGPFFGLLWRIGLEKFEGEIHIIKKDKK